MRKSTLFLFGLVVTAIVALGLVVLSSASEANGLCLYNDAFYFVRRQSIYLVVGIAVLAIAAVFDYRNWRNHPILVWIFGAIILILLCSVFGFRAINGSHRWIAFGPIRVQPGEFAKIATVIAVAVCMDLSRWKVGTIVRGAIFPAIVIGVFALPVLLEPDFGSVMVIGLVGFSVMFLGGTKILHMLPFLLIGGSVFVYKVITNANRMARIAAFLGVKIEVGAEVVDAAAERAAYQAHQALVAIGNGGIWGVGLNQSMQKHYYLPEAHTDFIFAIGAEELGLIFSIMVLVLFLAFFVFSIYIALNASDRFGRLLVIGMTFIIFFQAMFNIGVVCEALPTKGMALPFFSYGGTNLISSFFAVGTILSVGIQSLKDKQRSYLRKVIIK